MWEGEKDVHIFRWELAGKTAQAQLLMDWKVSLHTLKRMMAVVASLAPATTSDFKVYFSCDATCFAVITSQTVAMCVCSIDGHCRTCRSMVILVVGSMHRRRL